MVKLPDIARRILLPVVGLALLAAACSNGAAGAGDSSTPVARPSTTAHLKILSPTNGEVIHGSTVQVRVKLTGAKIVPATTTHIVPDEGHLHVYVDNQIVSMNFSTTDTVENVEPGMHVLRVEFVASDHVPFDPRDFTAVTFEVKP